MSEKITLQQKQMQQQLDAEQLQKDLIEVGYIAGGARVMQQIACSLNAQLLLTLERLQKSKLHERLSFKSFDEMLDNWEKSPMNSDKYYRQRKLLLDEGEAVFDIMTAMEIPATVRKQLKGQIQVEGDELVVGSQRLALSETTRVKAVLKDIALQQDKAAKKQADLEKEVKELKGKLVETVKAAANRPANPKQNSPHDQALLVARLALADLAKEANELDPTDREARRGDVLNQIGESIVALNEAYGLHQPKKAKADPNDKKAQVMADLVAELDDELFTDD